MVFTVYGNLSSVQSTSLFNNWASNQVTLCIPNHSLTEEEIKETIRLEFAIKARYLPAIDRVTLLIHEHYWTPLFARSFESYLPMTVTETVVKIVREGIERTYRYRNTRGTLDGVPRDHLDETTPPLHIGSSLRITLDILVTSKARVLDFIRDNPNELESLTILPPLQAGGSHIVYLDTVIQVISTTFSCVSIDVFFALDWTVDDVQEIEYTLNTRRH